MKYCPVCDSEFKDSQKVCVDCQESLISEEEYKKVQAERDAEIQKRRELAKKDFVKVKTVESFVEADRLRSALEREGISVLIRSFHDTAYDGVFILQKGWGRIDVPRQDKERAAQIIRDFIEAFPDVDSSEKNGSKD